MPFDLLGAARALIAVNTESARGNLGLRAPLTELARQTGLSLQVLEAAGTPHANYLFERPGTVATEPLLLLTHTDTVPAGPLDRWTVTSPFAAQVEGDKLYGLGSADVKVDLLCKLLAVERLGPTPLRRSVHVLGTFGEEIGLLGAKHFAKTGPFRPRFVVCGEPSELSIIHAHKGYLVARVRLGERTATPAIHRTEIFQGKAAHSSTPHLGDNAIQKALREPLAGAVSLHGGHGANAVPAECKVGFAADGRTYLPLAAARTLVARFAALVASRSPTIDAGFDPETTVSNLGLIEARDGELELLLDARLLPGHDPRALAAAFEEEVRALGGEVSFERENPAVYTAPRGPLCQAAVQVATAQKLNPTLQTKATNTEAAAFAGRAEAIVFGAGPSVGNAHCPNEYTRISQLSQAVDFYHQLILKLCR